MAEIVWKGGWSSTDNLSDITYYENDVVSEANVTYIATAEVAIGSPKPSSDMGNWNTFVSGALGTSGTSGATGAQGTGGSSGTSGTSGSSGFGVPTGGTSGQILFKNSTTSGDTSWATFNDVNVFEATFNSGQANAVTTPWGLTIYADLPSQQFYFSGSSAAAAKYTFGHRMTSYARISSGVFGGPSNLAWQVFTAGTWYPFWGDNTLNIGSIGDYEYGVFRAAASSTGFSSGQYEEFEYLMVVGSGYANNYLRIRKTK